VISVANDPVPPSTADDDPALVARRAELLAIARASIQPAWPDTSSLPSDVDQALAELVDGFVVLMVSEDPPESGADGDGEGSPRRRIDLRPGGFGGGKTRKVLNIGTNMKGAMGRYARFVLTVAGLLALAPWLGAISLLAVAADVWGDTQIQITERQAVVVWTLYNRGINSRQAAVSTQALRTRVSAALAEYGRGEMPHDEITAILPVLKSIRCVAVAEVIEANGEARPVWWLNEDVEVDLT
jgi:hypothetical protein